MTLNEVFLKPLIDGVFNLAKPFAIENKIEVQVEEFENLAIKADFFRIKQVLFNLLSNAIKYNKKDGKVLISVVRTKVLPQLKYQIRVLEYQ